MGRREVKPGPRAAVLFLLAINTVLATYSTMVMAEAPFVFVLLLALMALDRWERRPGWRWAGVEIVLLAFLVWLKEAGIGLAVGLVLYELWRRRWRRAVAVGGGVGALLLPGLVARLMTGVGGGRRPVRGRDHQRGQWWLGPPAARWRLGHLGLPEQRPAPVGAARRGALPLDQPGPRPADVGGL